MHLLTTVSSHISSTEIRDGSTSGKPFMGLCPRPWRNTFWDRLFTGDHSTLSIPKSAGPWKRLRISKPWTLPCLNLPARARSRIIFCCAPAPASRRFRRSAKPLKNACDRHGRRVAHREGKSGAEWVLLDYGFFVVHIFSERARQYYDLERLWRNAERIDFTNVAPRQHAPNPAMNPRDPKATPRSNERFSRGTATLDCALCSAGATRKATRAR